MKRQVRGNISSLRCRNSVAYSHQARCTKSLANTSSGYSGGDGLNDDSYVKVYASGVQLWFGHGRCRSFKRPVPHPVQSIHGGVNVLRQLYVILAPSIAVLRRIRITWRGVLKSTLCLDRAAPRRLVAPTVIERTYVEQPSSLVATLPVRSPHMVDILQCVHGSTVRSSVDIDLTEIILAFPKRVVFRFGDVTILIILKHNSGSLTRQQARAVSPCRQLLGRRTNAVGGVEITLNPIPRRELMGHQLIGESLSGAKNLQ